MIEFLQKLNPHNKDEENKIAAIEKNQEEINKAAKEHEEATQRLTKLILENGFHVLLANVVGIKHK